MEYNVFRLFAETYQNLPQVTVVVNKNELPYFIWVKIPSMYKNEFELIKFEEVNNSESAKLDMDESISRDGCRPWFKVKSRCLNLTSGQHIYRMSLVNVCNDSMVYLYFSYILQDDDPDKSYIYMNRSEERCCCETSNKLCSKKI